MRNLGRGGFVLPQLISGFPSAISALPQGTLSAHGFLRRHMDSINPTTHAPYLSVAKTLHFHTQSLLHLRAGHRKASSSSLKGHLPLFFFMFLMTLGLEKYAG